MGKVCTLSGAPLARTRAIDMALMETRGDLSALDELSGGRINPISDGVQRILTYIGFGEKVQRHSIDTPSYIYQFYIYIYHLKGTEEEVRKYKAGKASQDQRIRGYLDDISRLKKLISKNAALAIDELESAIRDRQRAQALLEESAERSYDWETKQVLKKLLQANEAIIALECALKDPKPQAPKTAQQSTTRSMKSSATMQMMGVKTEWRLRRRFSSYVSISLL